MQVCTLLQTDNYASTTPLSFLQAGCPSCRQTNSVIALKAQQLNELITQFNLKCCKEVVMYKAKQQAMQRKSRTPETDCCCQGPFDGW